MNVHLSREFDNSIEKPIEISKSDQNQMYPIESLKSNISIKKIENQSLQIEKTVDSSIQAFLNQNISQQDSFNREQIFESKTIKDNTRLITEDSALIGELAESLEIKKPKEEINNNKQTNGFEKEYEMQVIFIEKQHKSQFVDNDTTNQEYTESVDDQFFSEFEEKISGEGFDEINKTEEETNKTEEETNKTEEKTDQKDLISDELKNQSNEILIRGNKAAEQGEKIEKQGEKTKKEVVKFINESIKKLTLNKNKFFTELNNGILNEYTSQGFRGVDTKLVKKYLQKHVNHDNPPTRKHLNIIAKRIIEKNIDAGGVSRNGIPETRESFKKYEKEFEAAFNIFYDTKIKSLFDSRRSEIEKEIQSKNNQGSQSNSALTKAPEGVNVSQQVETRVTLFFSGVSEAKFIRILEERLAEFSAQMEALQRSRMEKKDEKHYELMHSIIKSEILKMELMSGEVKKKSLQIDISSRNILTAELKPPHTFLIGEVR